MFFFISYIVVSGQALADLLVGVCVLGPLPQTLGSTNCRFPPAPPAAPWEAEQ